MTDVEERLALAKIADELDSFVHDLMEDGNDQTAFWLRHRAAEIRRLSASPAPGWADRNAIIEAMWRGELRRAARKERNVPWSEVSETDQDRWLYLADAAITTLPPPAGATTGWQPIETAPKDASEIIYLNKFGEIGFCYWSEAGSPFDESIWYDEQADDECCPLYWLPRSHLPSPPTINAKGAPKP